jgi:Spy/CpxP family protein refolding chaperone
MKLPIALLSFAMAGALMAQKTLPPQNTNNDQATVQSAHRAAVNRSDWMVQRLTKRLDLTQDQQDRVKAIFADSKTQAKALNPQLREERMELKAAVKSDSPSQIDHITQQNATLNSQAEAIHVKAMAKVYALLTPAQKAKFDHMDARRVSSRFHKSGAARS